MERRDRAFREFAAVVRERDRPFAERLREGLRLGREALGVEYGGLAHVDDGEYHVLAAATEGDVPLAAGDTLSLTDTYCRTAVSRGEAVDFGRASEGPEGVTDRYAHTGLGFDCYIGAPVTGDGRIRGTVCFADREPRPSFEPWEVELVESLGAWTSDQVADRTCRLGLEQAHDRLDGFAAMVDHDLREPLSTARGAVTLAGETGGDDRERHLETAATALARTDRLAEDLLRLAGDAERAGGGAPVDVRTAAEHAWDEATDGGATAARLAPTAGVHVPGDEPLVKRLLQVAFRGCLETCPPDADPLRVEVGPLADHPGFYVADDGPGVPGEASRPVGDEEPLAAIERVAAAHDWSVTGGRSDAGGFRVAVETDEGLWPTLTAPGDGRSSD